MMIHDSPFDSQIYGLKIGKLVLASADDLTPALSEARAARFDVVFLRISDPAIADALARSNILPLETLVTSVRATAPVTSSAREIVAAHPGDLVVEHHATLVDPTEIAIVAELTAEAITISHLHADPRLPRERTRQLYATWATNDVTGRAQRTLLARVGTEIVGYITVLLVDRGAVIDLVAAKPSWHGRGIGSALLTELVAWIDREGLAAWVGTQSDNPALRLYQRFGFVPHERHSTYHLWLDG